MRFHEQLDQIYGKDEVESMFYLATDRIIEIRRVDFILNPSRIIDESVSNSLKKVIQQLKEGEPIQYILGETEFFGLPLKVNQHVLIPRPETEELVAMVLNKFGPADSELNILDIGTGSGCIAISLAKNLPKAKVWAMDISKEAINVAQLNAEMNQVKITFISADILDNLSWDSIFNELRFDIIISNPPYVRQLERTEMKINVLNHEPHLALFVNNDNPLIFYLHIKEFAKKKLKSEGMLYLEINQYLGNQTKDIFDNLYFEDPQLHKDLSSNDRFISVKRKKYTS